VVSASPRKGDGKSEASLRTHSVRYRRGMKSCFQTSAFDYFVVFPSFIALDAGF
jgi:hypothetical protein